MSVRLVHPMLHYRSELCEQVVSFISQSQSFLCKKCQKLKLNIEAKTEKETNRCDNNKENVYCNIPAKGDEHPLSYIKEHSGPKNLSEKSTWDKDEIFVSESDHADLSNISESVFPNASDKMKMFLKSQHDICVQNHHRLDDGTKMLLAFAFLFG